MRTNLSECAPAAADKLILTQGESENTLPPPTAALAKLYGEPLLQLPHDLYIPPEALAVFLEAFEGPLDLLLYLIRKQNFNVLDIPMAQVTHQYLAYIEQIRTTNLELAAEYLLMAAMLIEIKSRMLLPVPKAAQEEDDIDPRADLVRRLLEYEQTKLAARHLNDLPQLGRDMFPANVVMMRGQSPCWPDVNSDDLRQALRQLMQRANLTRNHTITHEHLSVREYMGHILRSLQSNRFVEFTDLFAHLIDTGQGAAIVVVNFIALLELARETLVEITQVEPFAPIYISLSYQQDTTLLHDETPSS